MKNVQLFVKVRKNNSISVFDSCGNYNGGDMEVPLEITVWVIREFCNSKDKDTKGEVI